MFKESVIYEFQNINQEYDIMGVIRTLFPNNEFVVTIEQAKEESHAV